MKKNLILVTLLFMATVSVQAQVTIGGKKNPEPFSILELISGSAGSNGNRGLRLPRLTTTERDKLNFAGHTIEAIGLQIFNRCTRCVETWNSTKWIQSCGEHGPCTSVTVDDALWLTTEDNLIYTYLATETPYTVTPTLVEFLDGTTLVGVYTSEPFEHTFTSTPSDVKVVLSYPPFDAGTKPEDETITVGTVEYNMVGIPGGTFDMGFTEEEYNATGLNDNWDAWSNRVSTLHEHSVNVSSFSIGETEVTQELWQEVMGNNPSYYKATNQHPVEHVTWYDVLVFCNQLSMSESGKTPVYSINGSTDPGTWGPTPSNANADWDKVEIVNNGKGGYRLPTEAEWEYAARGGENYLYSGSNNICEVAWYLGNNDTNTDCGTASNILGTKEVKHKARNAYGLFDMSGNVMEWCFDGYNNYQTGGRVSNLIQEVCLYGYRMLRGGNWGNAVGRSAVSHRGYAPPYDHAAGYGFRVVLSL
jgi:formylglycine-generating enzyme required for sulfatase activity